MSGYVYFLTCRGRLKVGFARDVRKRVVALQNSAPFQLQLVGSIRGNRTTERAIHDRLAAHWSHGEWFVYSPEAQTAVSELLTGAAVPLPPKKPRKVHERRGRVELPLPPWAQAIRNANNLLARHEEMIAAAPPEHAREMFNIFAAAVDELDAIISADDLDEAQAPAWFSAFQERFIAARSQMRGLGPVDRSGNRG